MTDPRAHGAVPPPLPEAPEAPAAPRSTPGPTAPQSIPVAVVGMDFRLPGADTPEEFWRTIHEGADRIRRFTEAELEAAGITEEQYRADDFVGASGVLDDIAGFDAAFFGMSAHEARITDPQHRLFLESVHHALENAGYAGDGGGGREGEGAGGEGGAGTGRGHDVGVYASTGYHLYSLQTYLQHNVLKEGIADWVAGLQVTVGNFTDFTANRVAYRLGLTGPAVNIQTACSSSLTAVYQAAQSVAHGECDIASRAPAILCPGPYEPARDRRPKWHRTKQRSSVCSSTSSRSPRSTSATTRAR
ncbi:hypothetical protein SALBM135S_00650 [Streptomyces alboniger]